MKKMRCYMPNYMCTNILQFVAKNKDEVIKNELIHYIRNKTFLQPRIKSLMHSLISKELFKHAPPDIPSELAEALTMKPHGTDVKFTFNGHMGLYVRVIHYFHWPRNDGSGESDCVQLESVFRRKRTEEIIIHFIMPHHWKSTPITGIYTIHDARKFINGKLERRPNPFTQRISDIIMSHLPNSLLSIIHQAQKSNTCMNLQDVAGKILCLPGKRKHPKTIITVDFHFNTQNQSLLFDKKLKTG